MPAKPARIKAPTLATRAAFEETVNDLARIEVDLRAAEAERDAQIQRVREAWEPNVNVLKEQRDGLALAAEKFAAEHRDELFPTKVKSSETTLATFGYRLGQPTLKLLNRKWSWEKVIEELKARGLSRLIRKKEEPDKEGIKELPEAQLASVGVRIDQAETFFVEPKDYASAA